MTASHIAASTGDTLTIEAIVHGITAVAATAAESDVTVDHIGSVTANSPPMYKILRRVFVDTPNYWNQSVLDLLRLKHPAHYGLTQATREIERELRTGIVHYVETLKVTGSCECIYQFNCTRVSACLVKGLRILQRTFNWMSKKQKHHILCNSPVLLMKLRRDGTYGIGHMIGAR